MIAPVWIADPLALVGALWLAWRLLVWIDGIDTSGMDNDDVERGERW